MDFAALLALVTQLIPAAKGLIDLLHGASTDPNPTSDVLDLINKLAPQAVALWATIEMIRSQTEAQHPEVWAKVRADYMTASTKFDTLRLAAGTAGTPVPSTP